MDQDTSTNELRGEIEHAREGLAAKLEELTTRADETKDRLRHAVSLRHYVQQRPWLMFGASVGAGYMVRRTIVMRRERRAIGDGGAGRPQLAAVPSSTVEAPRGEKTRERRDEFTASERARQREREWRAEEERPIEREQAQAREREWEHERRRERPPREPEARGLFEAMARGAVVAFIRQIADQLGPPPQRAARYGNGDARRG